MTTWCTNLCCCTWGGDGRKIDSVRQAPPKNATVDQRRQPPKNAAVDQFRQAPAAMDIVTPYVQQPKRRPSLELKYSNGDQALSLYSTNSAAQTVGTPPPPMGGRRPRRDRRNREPPKYEKL
mmetsp:Transcript_17662/g.21762  ORF Transcript_17662/g.21762 Transcript_17662/m.21762 type:complete len:122 (+) Transcript_17662:193-558(+)